MKKNILFSAGMMLFVCVHSYAMMLTVMGKQSAKRFYSTALTQQTSVIDFASIYPYILRKNVPNIDKKVLIREKLKTENLSVADRNTLSMIRIMLDSSLREIEEMPTLLHEITKQKNPDLLNLAMIYGFGVNINAQDMHLNTPLYIASTTGLASFVETFITANANVNMQNEHGRTAFIGALLSLHESHVPEDNQLFVQIITMLKQAGADTSIVDDNNKTVDNYLRNILEQLEKNRQRTVRNEQGDLIHMYQSIRELLLKE
jgi:hypothetical protein